MIGGDDSRKRLIDYLNVKLAYYAYDDCKYASDEWIKEHYVERWTDEALLDFVEDNPDFDGKEVIMQFMFVMGDMAELNGVKGNDFYKAMIFAGDIMDELF